MMQDQAIKLKQLAYYRSGMEIGRLREEHKRKEAIQEIARENKDVEKAIQLYKTENKLIKAKSNLTNKVFLFTYL